MSTGLRFMETLAAFRALALGGCTTLDRGTPGQLAPDGGAGSSSMTGPSGAPGENYPGGPPSGPK
jgi:hypothetical protein